MGRRAATALAFLILLAAGCCPVPTARHADARIDTAEARVAVVTDGEASAGGASTARGLADGRPLLLRPADGVVVAPHARLYLVGRWLDGDTLFVTSAHPVVDAHDASPTVPPAPPGARR